MLVALHLTANRAKRALPWCFRHLDKIILLNRLKSAAPRYRALTT